MAVKTIKDDLGFQSLDGQKVSSLKNQNLFKENVNVNVKDFSGTAIKDITGVKAKDNPTVEPTNQQRGITTNNLGNVTNNYDDIAGNKQAYKPNSGVDDEGNPLVGGGSNTGQGAEAAVGTEYSWNKQGSSEAQAKYTSDVLEQKQALLNNRQTAENNAVNYQAQADMMKYQNQQNAEKVGWTGGYVLDQNRQMDYLKASIQAQMYGAMELQKYGYDSSLAAARLSYDLNQQEYARQYYQEAVTAALSEAQLTGVYFSAETKDMMGQLAVARQKAADESLPEAEREQANKLIDTINSWFSENGVSKEGVKTMEAWQQEQTQELAWSQELYTRYQAAVEAANTNISENPSTFIMLDSTGKEIWDGINVKTGNWESWTNQDVTDYLFSGTEGGINSQAVQQYYSYLDSTLVGETEAGFNKWCVSKGYITTDENGNSVVKAGDFTSLFLQYLKESNIAGIIASKFSDVEYDKDPEKNREKEKLLEQIFEQWDFRFQMPDGTYKDYTYDQLQEIENIQSDPGSGTPGTNIEVPVDPNNPDAGTTTVKDYGGVEIKTYSYTNPIQSQHGDWKSTMSTGTQICYTPAYMSNLGDLDIFGSPKETDIAVNFGSITGTDCAGGYNVEIANNEPSLTGSANEIASIIYKCTGNVPKFGQIITCQEKAYVYIINKNDLKSNGSQDAIVNNFNYSYDKLCSGLGSAWKTGWYEIKSQCNKGNKLTEALKEQGMLV